MTKKELQEIKEDILKALDENPKVVLFATNNGTIRAGTLSDQLLFSTIVNEEVKEEMMEIHNRNII